MQLQRATVESDSGSGMLWLGLDARDEVLPADAAPEQAEWRPAVEDWYVVADERVAGAVGMVVAPWPEVDGAGRLMFSEQMELVWFREDALLEVVDGWRTIHDQDLRPIRIGDVFWVHGDPVELGGWADMRDVTAESRDAAKVAAFATAAGAVPVEDASELGLVRKEDAATRREPPPPPGSGVTAAL